MTPTEMVLYHEQDIKRQELYIKLYRVNLMQAMSRKKQWEYYIKHKTFPVWENAQETKLNKIWDSIMAEIHTINNN